MNNDMQKIRSLLIGLTVIGAAAVSAGAQSLTITNGMTLWLKADALTGLTNGQTVAAWADSSPNGYNATQANPAMQPAFVTNGLGGKPVVQFAGDNLETPTIAALTDLTVFLVARSADINDRYALQFGHDTRAVIEGFGTNAWRWFNSPAIVTLAPMSTTTYQTIWTTNGTSYAGVWHIGADGGVTAPFAGGIAEVLVFNRVLSSSEVVAVGGYFEQKYGVDALPEPTTASLFGLGAVLILVRTVSRGRE